MANNIIKMNRGDTYEFSLTVDDEASDTGKYVLQGNDIIYFGVMEPNKPFEQSIIRKTTNDSIIKDEYGNYYITITQADTEYLVPGVYYYSVKLHINHIINPETAEVVDKVVTVINKTKFIILD